MLRRGLALALLGLLAAPPASAALLGLAGSTLTIEIPTASCQVTGNPCSVTFLQTPGALPVPVSSGSGGFGLPAGLFAGTQAVPTQLFTGVPFVSAFTVALANQPMTFSAGGGPVTPGGRPRPIKHIGVTVGTTSPHHGPGGGFGGPGPLSDGDVAIINVLALFNLSLPLSPVGQTGVAVRVKGGSLQTTVAGTGWTTGVVSVTGITALTPNGALVNTVAFAGFDNRTPGHAGVVQLISPFKAITSVAGNLPGLATLRLSFFSAVPEPGTLLLLAVATGWLAREGARRTRRP